MQFFQELLIQKKNQNKKQCLDFQIKLQLAQNRLTMRLSNRSWQNLKSIRIRTIRYIRSGHKKLF